ncbi:MAG TPA: M28 family peptidase, partial [Myxococcota bacterium]|nr:M28 family peptidase [Myxococcota bacterium]
MVSPMRTLGLLLFCGVLAACGPMGEGASTGPKKVPRGATAPSSPAQEPIPDPPSPPPLPEYPDLPIDPNYLAARLRELSGAVNVVINGQSVRMGQRSTAAGLDQARAYLAQEYTKLGFTVSQHTGWGGTNFIADRRGADERYLILSAHIDAVPGSPGADDDGSGVVM